MIHVTRFDGTDMVLNANLIEHIEASPDTVITLVNRKRWVVREPADEVLRRVISYQRAIGANATRLAAIVSSNIATGEVEA